MVYYLPMCRVRAAGFARQGHWMRISSSGQILRRKTYTERTRREEFFLGFENLYLITVEVFLVGPYFYTMVPRK